MSLPTDFHIVGAGPVGLVTSLLLSKQGFTSTIYEGRADPREVRRNVGGRSISFTLTTRGWKTLRAAGVEEELRRLAMPLSGRTIHLEASAQYHPYGGSNESIDCIGRSPFVAALLDLASADPNVDVRFEHRCLGWSSAHAELTFDVRGVDEPVRVPTERVIATDGVYSSVRRSFADADRAEFGVRFSRHFYREITISGRDGDWPLDPRSLHVWPREDCLVVAFPNQSIEHRLTGTVFLPLEGPLSFNSLSSPRALRRFFEESLPDLEPLMPNLIGEFFGGPPSSLISMRCKPWTFDGRVVLVGDAAHAMVPFLGQGLNAGLEDALVLTEAVKATPHAWSQALQVYEAIRKPSCDAVTELAEQHYRELALDARDPSFFWRKRIEARLSELLPELFAPIYAIVSFSERPYTEAERAAATQRRLVDELLALPGLYERWDTPALDDELRAHAVRVLVPTSSATSRSA